MRKIILFLIISLFICGCDSKQINYANPSNEEINSVMATDDYIIIDVRTKEEYDDAHISNAINIPYNEITEEIDIDKTKTLLVYCQSGNRSKIAFNKLNDLGYITYDLGAFSEIDLPKE